MAHFRNLRRFFGPTVTLGFALVLWGCLAGGDHDPTPRGWFQRDSTLAVHRLFDVHFPNADTGYAVGDSLIRTVDGGATWTTLNTGAEFLHTVFFLNGRTGWAAGVRGTVHRTTDGGQSWEASVGKLDASPVQGLYFVDSLIGFCVGDGHAVFKTTDGGVTWSERALGPGLEAPEFFGVHFPVPDTGYVVGASGVILRTVDGGETWTSRASGTLEDLYAVQFVSATTGYAAGAGDGSGSVRKTVDAGVTWADVSGASAASQGHLSLHFIDPLRGWVAGDFGEVYRTTDGGATWLRQPTPRQNTLRSIHFTDANRGWAVEMYGGLIETRNGGVAGSAE